MSFFTIHHDPCVLWSNGLNLDFKQFSVLKSAVQFLTHSHSCIDSCSFKFWSKRLQINWGMRSVSNKKAVAPPPPSGAWVQGSCLLNWKQKEKKRKIWKEIKPLYGTLIHFGNPKVYKVMTAAKNTTLWFHFYEGKRQQRKEVEGAK